MSRYYSVLVITVVVINGLHCTLFTSVRNNRTSHGKVTTYRHSPESNALLFRQQLKLNDDLLLRGH